MSTKQIYISGAVSGLGDQITRKIFREAQERWQKMNFSAINPFDLYDVAKKHYDTESFTWGIDNEIIFKSFRRMSNNLYA